MRPLLPPPRRRTRVWTLSLSLLFGLGLAALTLTPSRVEARLPNVLDLVLTAAHRAGWTSLDFTRLEIIANVLVFIPIGIAAFVLLPRRIWPVAFLVGPALSVAIEVAQRLALPHRAATVSDVIANSAGSTIGVVIAIVCTMLSTVLFASRISQPPSSRLEAS